MERRITVLPPSPPHHVARSRTVPRLAPLCPVRMAEAEVAAVEFLALCEADLRETKPPVRRARR